MSAIPPPTASRPVELSIVAFGRDEVANVKPFLLEVQQAFTALNLRGEVIYVDDGSVDGTGNAVEAFAAAHPEMTVRLLRHQQSRGITETLRTGFAHVTGDLVCLLPSDLESRPADDVPRLYAGMDANTDVVCGRRLHRGDGKQLASKVFAVANRWLFGVQVHDSNWIKLIRREKLIGLQLYPDWHRFLVALLLHRGCRVTEVETLWHRRRYGRSKFGLARIPSGLSGAIAVMVYIGYRNRGLLFFVTAAAWALLAAAVAAAVALWFGSAHPVWVPAWFYSIAAQAVAVLAVAFGLVVEFGLWRQDPTQEVVAKPSDDPR